MAPSDRAAADLVEASLRRALSAPRLSGYKPRRFAAGDERGGEFAPKGMGTVAYGAIKDAVDGDRTTKDVVWSGPAMEIIAPPDAPDNRPDWKPSMTRGEAEQWRQGNVLIATDAGTNEFYHGTSASAKESITAEGFTLSQTNFGRLWGDGVYLTPEFKEAHDYALESQTLGGSVPQNVVTVFPRVTNPALLDMKSPEWEAAKASTEDHRGWYWFRESIIAYFDLQADFDDAKANDGIERSGSWMQWVSGVLRDRGHDALVISGAEDHARTTNMVVVFDPQDVVVIKDAKPPKWAQRHYGMVESALAEAVRSPRLRGYVPKRYAKGTTFGGRFLPKGVSPFSAPSTMSTSSLLRDFLDAGFDNDVLRAAAYGEAMRAHDAHGPDFLDDWSESTEAAVVHKAMVPIGTIARDVQVDDQRRVRVLFDRETFSTEDDSVALNEYFAEVESHLAMWSDKAPDAEGFPPYILFTDKRSPSDAEMGDQFGGDTTFQADATADALTRGIVFWNIGGIKHGFSVMNTGYVVNPEILDHEIGHSIGDHSGPPDFEQWANAVNDDLDPFHSRGLMFYAESVGDMRTGYFVREYGVSQYANRHMVETTLLVEDWAEAVRIYMKEKRTGVPHYVVGRVPEAELDRVRRGEAIEPDLLEPEPMWFKDWSPEKYAIVKEFIDPSGMVETALNEALGRVGSISSGMFSARDAMYLKGAGGRFVGSRGRPGRSAVAADASRALSSQRAQRIAQSRTRQMMQRERGEKSVTLGVTPFRGAGAAQGEDYYETTRYKGFVNDIGRFAEEEGVSVKSIERVRGVWRGGGEPSAAVTLFGRDESVRRVMDRLGSKYNQDGVISFRQSDSGASLRFASTDAVDPKTLEDLMLQERFSAIAGATILPDGRVEFINVGGDEEVTRQIRGLVAALGVEFDYTQGNAELRFIEEHYPRPAVARSGSGPPLQEGEVQSGRSDGDVLGQGRGSPGKGRTGQEAALAEAIRGLVLSKRAQPRYAKGTVFGGRFLPKGVSAYSAPRISAFRYHGAAADLTRHIGGSDPEKHRWSQEQIGLGPMTRVMAVTKRPNLPSSVSRAEISLPSIDSFLPDHSVNMKNWSRVDEAVSVEHTDHMNGMWVRDLTLRRGRKIRIMVDHDLDVARTEDGRERLFAHLEDKLSVWAEAAPRKRVSKQLVITSQPYRDAVWNEPDLKVLGTADTRTRVITVWNMPQHFGRSDRMEIEGKAPFAELPLKTIDHELALTIAPKGGPPDAKLWEEAMVRDRRHMEANGFGHWIVPDWEAIPNQDGAHPPKAWQTEDGQVRWHSEKSDVWGITRYASRTTGASVVNRPSGSPKTHEDWAESVAMFMAQERANIGVIPALIEVPGAGTLLLRVDFYDWAPNRARLIQQYMQSGNQTRKDEIVEKFGLYRDDLLGVMRWPGAIMPWGEMMPMFQYDPTPDLSNPLDQLLHDTDKQVTDSSTL